MTKLVGILNITPDSFSDGGKFTSLEHASQHLDKLINDGADLIDIGAESTRPGAKAMTHEEEWERLSPVLSSLIHQAHQQGCGVCLDTMHAQNAQKAVEMGVDIINDQRGLTQADMLDLATRTSIPFVIMHHLGIPVDKSVILDDSKTPTQHIIDWAHTKLDALQSHGIDSTRIIIDPGIGFGKSPEQSLYLIDHCDALVKQINAPIYVGHSRKSFLSARFPNISKERDSETLEISKHLIQNNVAYVRVHNIAIHRTI